MGIEPFLVATSVNLICAQRLCAASVRIARKSWKSAAGAHRCGLHTRKAKTTKIYHGKGCNDLQQARLQGRTVFTKSWKSMMSSRIDPVGASALELKKKASSREC